MGGIFSWLFRFFGLIEKKFFKTSDLRLELEYSFTVSRDIELVKIVL